MHYDEQYEEQERAAEADRRERRLNAVDALEEAIRYVPRGGTVEQARAASIAITHIETAILWLKK